MRPAKIFHDLMVSGRSAKKVRNFQPPCASEFQRRQESGQPGRRSVADNVMRYSAMVLVAMVVAIGIAFGLRSAGESVAQRIPQVSMDLPSLPEIVDTIKEPEPYQDISPAMIDSIQAMSSLTTVEYTEHTTIERGTDSSWLDWARGDTIVMLAVADIGAGVSLEDMTVDSFIVEQSSGVVQIQNAYRDDPLSLTR